MASKANMLLDSSGFPIEYSLATIKDGVAGTWCAGDLIRFAQEHPPEAMMKGLLNKGDILLLHGSEESFKSVFVLQMAESLSKGREFLSCWKVPKARRVGVIETEMHEVMLGERLAKMFPGGDPPENLLFMAEDALRGWRRLVLRSKFESIQGWVNENRIEILMIDTANDFFRGADNPSDERNVGEFFDELRSLKVDARMIVRHDRKKNEADGHAHSNERIRGSAEWKEDPEAIIALQRPDRRTHAASLEIGKLRYGAKPEPFTIWFDKKTFRLTPLPPVIEILSMQDRVTRESIVSQCEERFSLSSRKVDEMIGRQSLFLKERMIGHSKAFEIDLDRVEQAPWCRFLLGE
jgi:hypothetical protein